MSSLATTHRITGLDMARALAIFGMFMAHIGPSVPRDGQIPNPDLIGATYRVVHGRSAILFGVLAGVGVAILASRNSTQRETDFKLVWRALVLFVMGLWLQTLDMPVAIILHYYAILFLVGMVATRLGNRMLITVAASSVVLGSLTVLGMWTLAPDAVLKIPEWFRIHEQLLVILVAGYYPVVTWTAPFLVGMWLGRHNFHSPNAPRKLLMGGFAITAASYLVSITATAWWGAAQDQFDWRILWQIRPHNQMPLWLVSATGIACFVIGLCLYATRQLPRLSRPLVLVGQMAFSVYVAQIWVLTLAPEWVAASSSYGAAWLSAARMVVVTVLVVILYRAVLDRGPFEWLIRAPWDLPRTTNRVQPTR